MHINFDKDNYIKQARINETSKRLNDSLTDIKRQQYLADASLKREEEALQKYENRIKEYGFFSNFSRVKRNEKKYLANDIDYARKQIDSAEELIEGLEDKKDSLERKIKKIDEKKMEPE